MHPNNVFLIEKYARSYFRPGLKVLEIGPNIPSWLQGFVGGDSLEWHTVDIYENPQITYTARDEYSFPIPDHTYDIVIAANVLEHVRKIWVWIKEAARVCKPGGHVITVNPVSWPYHEVPIDCWRIYPEGMKALYEEGGLEVILSRCESLEAPHHPQRIPGRSQETIHDPNYLIRDGWKFRYANKVLERIGYPIERAYDTITIGRKPVSEG